MTIQTQKGGTTIPRVCCRAVTLTASMVFISSCSVNAQSFDAHDRRSPLYLVRSIDLPNVKGRIDHLALDPQRNRLFIGEYGNGSVDEVDLTAGKVIGRITGLHEPQGVAWLPKQQEIAVASGDGLVTFYRASDRQRVADVQLGDDADDVRVDPRNGNLVVGYGSGGLAVIDPSTHHLVRRLALPAHPEAFSLIGARVFVNVPDAHKIIIGNLDRAQVTLTLGTGHLFGNFPMALDHTNSRIAIAYRLPGTLSLLNAVSGATLRSSAVCGDADDIYFRASQIVVVCGAGAVELESETDPHARVRVVTERGARTGLLDPDHARLFVAVPAHSGPASIWELSFRQ